MSPLRYIINPSQPTSLAAVLALHEMQASYCLADPSHICGRNLPPVQCEEPDGSDGRHIDCHSLLEMLLPPNAFVPKLEAAWARTITAAALALVSDVVRHKAGDPEMPLSRRVMALVQEVEDGIAGPVWAPEQFTFVAAEHFNGESLQPADIAFAALFHACEGKLPLAALKSAFPKSAAWRHALLRRPCLTKAAAELHITCNGSVAAWTSRRLDSTT